MLWSALILFLSWKQVYFQTTYLDQLLDYLGLKIFLLFRATEGIEEEGEDIDLISKLEDMTINKEEKQGRKLNMIK